MTRFLLPALVAAATAGAEWRTAQPGWEFAFPRDHGNHPEFKTEWWYLTGNLKASDGREYGCQLTFFRQGVGEFERDVIAISRFVTRHIKFAHFALTDIGASKFTFRQKVSRGAFGEAGFDSGGRLAWIDGWSLELRADGTLRARAETGQAAIDLECTPAKVPVVHGAQGVSRKAAGGESASHYYSLTRLATKGTIRVEGQTRSVEGLSWFDHEWASNQLAADQAGWDWLSGQFEDGSELMLYRMRKNDGSTDAASSGTWIAPDGSSRHLSVGDFFMTPTDWWTSGEARYPIGFELVIPQLDLRLTVNAPVKHQELRLKPVSYWEGAVRLEGRRSGQPLRGSGYLELTGYAGKLDALKLNPAGNEGGMR